MGYLRSACKRSRYVLFTGFRRRSANNICRVVF